MHAKYIHLSFIARFMPLTNKYKYITNINTCFRCRIKGLNSISSNIHISLIDLLDNGKVLEGFFNGPKILKYFGYFFII